MIVTLKYENPLFFDKKIQALNEKLEGLNWIQNQYHIAWMGEDEEGEYPEVYVNDGTNKNIRVLPSGNSMSFFQIEGDISEVEEYYYSVSFGLYVWADLSKIYKAKKYDYTSELIREVVNVLKDNDCNDITISTNNVLDEFTYLQKKIKQISMKPYTSFKISFTTIITNC